MKKFWLLGLALPLAGCAQRAELAPRQNTTPPGPFTLRYHFDTQQPDRYHVTATGDTTTSFARSNASPSTAPGSTGTDNSSTATPGTTSREAVHANFETDMVLNRVEAPATASADTTPAESSAASTSSNGSSADTATSPANGLNAPASTGANAPASEGTNAPDGTTAAPGKPAESSTATRIDQKIDQWNASVTLPDRKAPNQFRGSYLDNSVSVSMGGVPMPVPDRFKTQVQTSVQQPVTLTVSDLGEIRSVQWNGSATPVVNDDTRPIGFLTRSTAALNLWAGVIRLPDRAVNIGDSWDANDSFPVEATVSGSPVHLERSGHYILRNVTQNGADQVAIIDANETLKLLPGAAPAPAAGSSDAGTTNSTNPTGSDAASGSGNQPPASPPGGSEYEHNPSAAPSATGAGNAPAGTTATNTGNTASISDANALAIQTRSGSVYFDVTRGYVDHTDEQFTLRWGNRFLSASNSATAPEAGNGAEGQAQGHVTVQRVDTGFGLAPVEGTAPVANVPGASSTTVAGNTPATAPAANAPAANSPASGNASNAPGTP